MSARVFEVSLVEYRSANEWILTHKCKQTKNRSTTWMFTPTGIGTAVKLKCSCGEETDVTDYHSW